MRLKSPRQARATETIDNRSSFDLWETLQQCEVSVNLPTLVEISPICRKQIYHRLVRRRPRLRDRIPKERKYEQQV